MFCVWPARVLTCFMSGRLMPWVLALVWSISGRRVFWGSSEAFLRSTSDRRVFCVFNVWSDHVVYGLCIVGVCFGCSKRCFFAEFAEKKRKINRITFYAKFDLICWIFVRPKNYSGGMPIPLRGHDNSALGARKFRFRILTRN